MVLLSALWLALAPAHAEPGLQPWAALPAEGPAALAARADAALRGVAVPELSRAELPAAAREALRAGPACRRVPACRWGQAASTADLLVDARLEPLSPAVVQVELQLHAARGGGARVALFVPTAGLEAALRAEAEALLRPHAPAARLAVAAEQGDAAAAAALRAEHPESPYTPR